MASRDGATPGLDLWQGFDGTSSYASPNGSSLLCSRCRFFQSFSTVPSRFRVLRCQLYVRTEYRRDRETIANRFNKKNFTPNIYRHDSCIVKGLGVEIRRFSVLVFVEARRTTNRSALRQNLRERRAERPVIRCRTCDGPVHIVGRQETGRSARLSRKF